YLVNNLLDIDRMESHRLSIEPRKTPIATIVQRSVSSGDRLAARSKITIEVQPTDADTVGDEERLVQEMVDRLFNAVKLSPEGEKIDISCQVAPGWVTVSVSDRGRGIPAEYKDKIFNRFEQVEVADERIRVVPDSVWPSPKRLWKSMVAPSASTAPRV